jgi:thiosulfate reductase cytochrome b subunit
MLFYGIYIFITRRWKHRFLQNNDLKVLQENNNIKRKNYAWHRLAYTIIIPILLLSILTGLGMYKPAQLHWIVEMFGDWQALRIVHFIAVPIFVIFSIVHSLLALKVGGSRLVESMFMKS